jgi:hypothetical protein
MASSAYIKELGDRFGELEQRRHEAWVDFQMALFPWLRELGICVRMVRQSDGEVLGDLVPGRPDGPPAPRARVYCEDEDETICDDHELRDLTRQLCPDELRALELCEEQVRPVREELERYARGELPIED